MFSAFANVLRIPELRRRALWTLGLLILCRVGVFVPMPGIDVSVVQSQIEQTHGTAYGKLLGILDMFAGGGLRNASIFALGIMPYISASIIFQLLTAIVPALNKIAKEGESGRRKIIQWTRYSTVALCAVQALIICSSLQELMPGGKPIVLGGGGPWFLFGAAVTLSAGTAFLMWLGEQIDEFGLGNGGSMIIMIGIVSRLPVAIYEVGKQFDPSIDATSPSAIGPGELCLLFLMFIAMVVAVIVVTQATRRIPMQTPKRTPIGFRQQHFLPLKLNASGVIAIIFAQALMVVPSVLNLLPSETWRAMVSFLMPWSFLYVTSYMLLIIFFSYFYTAIMFDPKEHSETFKQHGMFIPGIRPGADTRVFLETVMNRITLAGAVFIAIIAIVPQLIQYSLKVGYTVSDFFGGTGLLIVVGVALDLVQRIESHLLMQHYEGFLKGGGRIRGRRG